MKFNNIIYLKVNVIKTSSDLAVSLMILHQENSVKYYVVKHSN